MSRSGRFSQRPVPLSSLVLTGRGLLYFPDIANLTRFTFIFMVMEGLLYPHGVVQTALFDQLLMCSLLDDFPVTENENEVSLDHSSKSKTPLTSGNGRHKMKRHKPMGDENTGASVIEKDAVDILHQLRLRARVKCGCLQKQESQ